MKTYRHHKILAWALAVCLLLCAAASALTEANAPAKSPSDFEALAPLMDLVIAAVQAATDEPEPIFDADGTLTIAFVDAFFRVGVTAEPSLGITGDMLTNTQQQAEYLGKVFSAKLPELEPAVPMEPANGYIGFFPKTVNTMVESDSVQIIGEMYWADRPMKQLADAEYQQVQWLESAVFTFQSDTTALNGFRLTGFSLGKELNMELAMEDYFGRLLVEYVNNSLGFSVHYPSVFPDDLLVEDQDGLSTELPDGSASFFAKRVDNVNNANLQDYVNVIANGLTDAQAQIDEKLQCATIVYTTEEGFTAFDIYVVTDRYIYHAELSYQTSLASQFSMYCEYLKNTFTVNEVSVG